MKKLSERPRGKKTLKVATALTGLTGLTAGVGAFAGAVPAQAAAGGWTIYDTMGAQVQWAKVIGSDVNSKSVSEGAFNFTGATDHSVEFTKHGIQFDYAASQWVTWSYGGSQIATQHYNCWLPGGTGKIVFRGTVANHSC
jgi:hypothetical protein